MWKFLLAIALVPETLFAGGVDLELGISVSKKEIVQFEPVAVMVWVTNVSKNPQKVMRAFDLSYGILTLWVEDSSGKIERIQPFGAADFIPAYMTLVPYRTGSGVHHRIMLSGLPGSWMDKPGKYRLYAKFAYAKGKEVGSSAAELTIKEADGVNKEALTRFRGFPQALFMSGVSTCPEIGFEFESVIQRYPKSDYVPWCYYILGRANQNSLRIPEQARAKQAREQYAALLKKFPDFPLKLEIQYEMARELFRLGEEDEAIREIEKLVQFREDNPNSELFLFYEARRILGLSGDGNHKVQFETLPSHSNP